MPGLFDWLQPSDATAAILANGSADGGQGPMLPAQSPLMSKLAAAANAGPIDTLALPSADDMRQDAAHGALQLLAKTAPYQADPANGSKSKAETVAELGGSTAAAQKDHGLLHGVTHWLTTPGKTTGLTGADWLTLISGPLQNISGDRPEAVARAGEQVAANRAYRQRQAFGAKFTDAMYGPNQSAGASGVVGAPAPVTATSGQAADPVAAQANAAAARQARIRQLQQMISRGQAGGMDMAPYAQMLKIYTDQADRDDYLNSLQPADRVAARLNPNAFIEAGVKGREPKFLETQGTIVKVDPAAGTATPLYSAPKKAPEGWEYTTGGGLAPVKGGPYDLHYVRGKSQAEASGQREGAPPEWVSHPETVGGTSSPARVLGPIYAKLAAGGWDALSDGERQAVMYYKMDPLTAGVAGSMDGGGGVQPKPQAQPRPVAHGKVQVAGGVYHPQSAADMQQVPIGAQFVNPANGQVLTRHR